LLLSLKKEDFLLKKRSKKLFEYFGPDLLRDSLILAARVFQPT
jgi:hypothetical protein